MNAARKTLWLPAFLVGGAVAASVATSMGLLLYNEAGIGRAAVIILGVTALSLAAGLWTGSTDADPEEVPSAARWWVGLLVALVFAAGFSGFWDAFQGFGANRIAQGTGLALMTALPTYFGGGVLGRIVVFSEAVSGGVKGRVTLGAGVGVVLGTSAVMTALGRPVLAVTAFLGAAIAASLGARVQGWIFDRVPRRRLLLKGDGTPGLRFEAWHTAVPDTDVRLLSERGEPVTQDPPAAGGWQDGVSRTVDGESSLLFVGAGAWFSTPDSQWTIYEPDPAVAGLGVRGLGWSEDSLVDSAVPTTEGAVVIVNRQSLDAVLGGDHSVVEYIHALEGAGVSRVWIGGVRTPPPRDLIEASLADGFHIRGYSGHVPGQEGPPRIAGRWEWLWVFQKDQVWPDRIGGLELEASEVELPEIDSREIQRDAMQPSDIEAAVEPPQIEGDS